MKFTCILTIVTLAGLLTGRSDAETIYGVDTTRILTVNTSTRVTTQLFNLSTWNPGGTAWAAEGNELAYDAFAHNLFFSERDGSRIGIYNLNTNTASIFADLDTFSSVTSLVTGGSVDTKMGGGAFFYNDSYYFIVESIDGTTGHSRLFRADLNTAHTAFTSIGVATFGGGNPWLGDFGDMAIKSDGTVYGSSSGSGSGVLNGFWTFNVNNLAAGVTSINTSTTLAQLAFSADQTTLYATHYSAGDFGTINMATGVFTSTGSLSGVSTAITDLTQATSPAPEPASGLLLVIGALLLFCRRTSRDPSPEAN